MPILSLFLANAPAWLLKNWKLCAGGAAAVAIAAGLLMLRHDQTLIGRARQATANAQAQTVVADSNAVAAAAATNIITHSADAENADDAHHEADAHALDQSPAAHTAIPAELNDLGRRGLCTYSAYAGDPACVQLRRAHPQGPQNPGSGDAAAR